MNRNIITATLKDSMLVACKLARKCFLEQRITYRFSLVARSAFEIQFYRDVTQRRIRQKQGSDNKFLYSVEGKV